VTYTCTPLNPITSSYLVTLQGGMIPFANEMLLHLQKVIVCKSAARW